MDGQTLCAAPLNSWGHFEGRMMLSLSSRLGSSREAMSLERGNLSLHITLAFLRHATLKEGQSMKMKAVYSVTNLRT